MTIVKCFTGSAHLLTTLCINDENLQPFSNGTLLRNSSRKSQHVHRFHSSKLFRFPIQIFVLDFKCIF